MTSLPERDRLLAELQMLTTVQGMLKHCKTVETRGGCREDL